MSLTQRQIREAILDSALPAPGGLSDGQGRPAGRRFDVYRNNVAVSLTEALELGFPVVRKLIGDENFRAVAGVFLRRHPPDSPMIALYGAHLPVFLQEFGPLGHLRYLPDVARLEQTLRECHHAADSHPIRPAILQGMPPESLLTARLTLAPALRLVCSPWPIHAIWSYNMTPGSPDPGPAAQNVLIARPEYDTRMTCLTEAEAGFVAALGTGDTFGAAYEAALICDAQFDLTATLATLLGGNAITAISKGQGT